MKIWLIVIFSLNAWACDAESCVIARTESGLVCGARKMAVNGNPIISFLGIPYAKPPLGRLRFTAPQPPEPWTGVFNATTAGPICPQVKDNFVSAFMKPTSMSEDCLHVNVHTPLSALPVLNSSSRSWRRRLLPVLVYIHGGAYVVGSGDPDAYGPEYLLTKDIILVTFNFRLGSLGFLTLRSECVPGNAGMKDSIAALTWVQNNIRNFGGDPSRVTVGGISSGAGLAHLLAVSPATDGENLFQRVIPMSFTAISNFATFSEDIALKIGQIYLKGLDIDQDWCPEDICERLAEVSMEELLEADVYVLNQTKIAINFVPVIQDDSTNILPRNPDILLDEGYGKDIPVLFGFTNEECILYKSAIDGAVNPLQGPAPPFANPIGPFIKSFLPNEDDVIDFCGDYQYKYPVFRTVDKRLATQSEATFVYQFSYNYEGPDILQGILGFNWTGTAHSGDATYIFRVNSKLPEITYDELDQDDNNSRMKIFMRDMVYNFASFGRPSRALAAWPSSGPNYKYMDINIPAPQIRTITPYLRRQKQYIDALNDIRSNFLLLGNKNMYNEYTSPQSTEGGMCSCPCPATNNFMEQTY